MTYNIRPLMLQFNHLDWQGTYIARDFKPVCPQPTGNAVIRDQMSEDCLYINVWTPFLPRRGDSSQSRRPVIVFIEGQYFIYFHVSLFLCHKI